MVRQDVTTYATHPRIIRNHNLTALLPELF